jgi:hypothetical protein
MSPQPLLQLTLGWKAGNAGYDMSETIPNTYDAKTAFNARAKTSMQEFLRSKSWEEKVESIERMNAAGKMAREAMRKALSQQEEQATAKR